MQGQRLMSKHCSPIKPHMHAHCVYTILRLRNTHLRIKYTPQDPPELGKHKKLAQATPMDPYQEVEPLRKHLASVGLRYSLLESFHIFLCEYTSLG